MIKLKFVSTAFAEARHPLSLCFAAKRGIRTCRGLHRHSQFGTWHWFGRQEAVIVIRERVGKAPENFDMLIDISSATYLALS
jgi:hypothetical protein